MRQLSNKEIKEVNEKLKIYKIEFKKNLAETEKDSINIIFYEKEPAFFYYQDKIIPTLHLLNKSNFLKTVTIDMPAVKFIVGGADVMRPGIVALDDFEKDEVVAIVDEKNKRPIAVGITLYGFFVIKSMDKGKVITNIHYIGDKVWTTGLNH